MAPHEQLNSKTMSDTSNDKQSTEDGGAAGKPAVMGRPSYSLEKVREAMGKADHFFPGDIFPHSQKFKRWCSKMADLGLLVKHGHPRDRYGYWYSFPACP